MTILGCIADDLTGATDLALVLTDAGMSTILVLGTPEPGSPAPPADAVVVALKTRTMHPDKAERQSLEALHWLQNLGAQRIFFKYCSTFDSTDQGNIGPVAEALADHLNPEFTVFCPAFPANGRTVYQGHLFVNGRLLSESSLADHPLTPMNDPDLVRVLQKQCRRYQVGLVPLEVVAQGTGAVLEKMEALQDGGCRFGIADAINDEHLATIADACAAQALMTGGSAVTAALPGIYRLEGRLSDMPAPREIDEFEGPVVLISGSCSEASRAQVEFASRHFPAVTVDPLGLASGESDVSTLLQAAAAADRNGAVLFHSTADPDTVSSAQKQLGRWKSGELVENTLAELAQGLVNSGIRKLVIAGGETSGAVARKLGLQQLRVGPEIDTGVPWMQSLGDPPLLLAFKSGNFGSEGFFVRAVEQAA